MTHHKQITSFLPKESYIFAHIYSCVITFLYPLVFLLSFFSKHLKAQFRNRGVCLANVPNNEEKKPAFIFFCSSAGEYEQARPLIERLDLQGKITHTFFFSLSGLNYAEARNDKGSYCLSPYDTSWNWLAYLRAIRPTHAIIVRHELWPGFLLALRAYGCHLSIVNLSRGPRETMSLASKMLLPMATRLFAVSQADEVYLRANISHNSIQSCGDTKYDRVVERARENAEAIETFRLILTNSGESRRFLTIGSGWHADINLVLATYIQLPTSLRDEWTIIVAPHDVSSSMIGWIKDTCQKKGLPCQLLSDISAEREKPKAQVIVADTMGKLSELYGCSHLAFVGGGLHAKIHNVLEPAAQGLRLAMGPRIESQQEAIALAESGLATVVDSVEKLTAWWLANQQDDPACKETILSKVSSLTGASDKILKVIETND